jgi:histidinol phosphatase-like PHP family hydrolase
MMREQEVATLLEHIAELLEANEESPYGIGAYRNDVWARRAKEAGEPLVIGTDAHGTHQLGLMRYGVAVARRAWLEPRDVLNTRPLAELLSRTRRDRKAA